MLSIKGEQKGESPHQVLEMILVDFLQDFCSSEAHSVPGKVKAVTETDSLAPLADLLALLKLLQAFTQESKFS